MLSVFELSSLDMQEVETHRSGHRVKTNESMWIDSSPPHPPGRPLLERVLYSPRGPRQD